MQGRLFDLLAEWALLDNDALLDAIAQRLGMTADAKMLAAARALICPRFGDAGRIAGANHSRLLRKPAETLSIGGRPVAAF